MDPDENKQEESTDNETDVNVYLLLEVIVFYHVYYIPMIFGQGHRKAVLLDSKGV